MEPHSLDTPAVMAALEEVVMRDFVLASGQSNGGGIKKLLYHPGRKVYRIVETTAKDIECGTAEMAAIFYTER